MTCVFLSRYLWREIRDLSDDISLDIKCDTRRQMRIKKARSPERIAPFFFFYPITFIPCSSSLFIIHVRTAALYEKELDGIRNWPSVLGTLLPSSWKAMSSQAQNSMANLRACRLSTASFRTVFFPLRFLNFCPRLCYLCPSRAPQFHLSSIHQIFVAADSNGDLDILVHILTTRLTSTVSC